MKSPKNGPGQPMQPPVINVLGQYLKDLSFENPSAPEGLGQREGQPKLNINVNVNGKPMSNNEFAVELSIDAKASLDETVLFNVEVVYGGVFRIQNVPQEHLHPFVMIECPRMLFPFARQIVSDAVQNGGFQPLFIDPIDFVALYQQSMARNAPGQSGIIRPA